MNKFKRVIVIVLDSVGIGEMPDAAEYGDAGSNTLGNIADKVGGLKLPNLQKLGLGNIAPVKGVPPVEDPQAIYGKAALAAPNKDTTSGHWEMMGCILDFKLRTFPEGFPEEFLGKFIDATGVPGVLSNEPMSGTEVIEKYGAEHISSGKPIVYTSADSVFQIACHEEHFGLERLYETCETARELLHGDWEVGRVIARPFTGEDGDYKRTSNRHDYSLEPVSPTVLDKLTEKETSVLGIGKIQDIFAGCGVPESIKTKDNADGMATTLKVLQERDDDGVIFVNLVDFDSLFGHRRNVEGYRDALEEFDKWLPSCLSALRDDDFLILCADHGNDPTMPGTDHSREYCPILATYKGLTQGYDIGIRASLADIGATAATNFGIESPAGETFLR